MRLASKTFVTVCNSQKGVKPCLFTSWIAPEIAGSLCLKPKSVSMNISKWPISIVIWPLARPPRCDILQLKEPSWNTSSPSSLACSLSLASSRIKLSSRPSSLRFCGSLSQPWPSTNPRWNPCASSTSAFILAGRCRNLKRRSILFPHGNLT